MKTICTLIFSCGIFIAVAQETPGLLYKEKYRPQYHFTPKANWINDPNGLLFFGGTYHLFYQYNPYANVWGHMTWAHATSSDLIHWNELPPAINETKEYMIFSGSAVADIHNSSGFAANNTQTPLVAIYTAHTDSSQKQHLAYSLDKGLTWQQYANNPVLDLGKKDFRDPGVFWYEPNKQWIMTVMYPIEHEVKFYSSANLKEWKYESSFGPAGDTSGVWECPQLMKVRVQDKPNEYKWVLMLSMNSAMEYFVGIFDGHSFVNENNGKDILRPDYGPDYYAAIAYNNLPADANPVTIGWINSWNYANDIPVSPWKGAMSLPRELCVIKKDAQWLLIQKPVEAIKTLRGNLYSKKSIKVTGSIVLPVKTQTAEIEFTMHVQQGMSGIKLAVGYGHSLEIGYDAATNKLFADRTNAGEKDFNKNYAATNKTEVDIAVGNKTIKLHIFLDKSMVEIFVNDGIGVITMQLFPDEKNDGIELFSTGGNTDFEDIKVWEMKSIWPDMNH